MSEYCVYKHTTPSKKVYIGITKQNPLARWKNGFGYSSSPHFWNAIQKYGWENIKHEILFDGLTKEDACYYERYFIDIYQSTDPKHGYNQKTGGEIGVVFNDSLRETISQRLKRFYADHPEKCEEIRRRVTGFKHSEATKAKMRRAERHPKHPNDEWKKRIGEANKKRLLEDKELYEDTAKRCRNQGMSARKMVAQFTLDGEFVAVFESTRAAERATGIRSGNISRCCRGMIKTSGNFKWQYAIEIQR